MSTIDSSCRDLLLGEPICGRCYQGQRGDTVQQAQDPDEVRSIEICGEDLWGSLRHRHIRIAWTRYLLHMR